MIAREISINFVVSSFLNFFEELPTKLKPTLDFYWAQNFIIYDAVIKKLEVNLKISFCLSSII